MDSRSFTIAACLGGIVAVVPASHAQVDKVDVVALVNEVRQKEQWIQHVDSFLLRLEGAVTKTPEAIVLLRAELGKQYPDVEEFDPIQFTRLQPEIRETLEIIFDSKRARYLSRQPGSRYVLRIWDGQRAIAAIGTTPDHITDYILDDKPQQVVGASLFRDLSWPLAARQSFWWMQIDAERWTEFQSGPIEDFKLVGRVNYRGIDCYVLKNLGGFRTWYVGMSDHLLYGFASRALIEGNSAHKVINEIAARRGRKFSSSPDYYTWKAEQPRDERRAMDREYYTALLPQSRPKGEGFMLDYQEVAPGMWFPMTQGAEWFLKEPDEDGHYGIRSRRELRVVRIELNEPMPDELFTIELVDGVRVTDLRYDFPLGYVYERNMPPEKWNEILAEAGQQYEPRNRANKARGELIGQAAPRFPKTQWLNSDPLTWADLRGKVVILDFWAEWCGPCRDDLPKMSDLHKERDKTGITVLGVHTPGSKAEHIQTIMKLYDLQYPIFIDIPRSSPVPGWGQLYEQYGIHGIPHAFVIDREGKIAGQGTLQEVLAIAQGLLP